MDHYTIQTILIAKFSFYLQKHKIIKTMTWIIGCIIKTGSFKPKLPGTMANRKWMYIVICSPIALWKTHRNFQTGIITSKIITNNLTDFINVYMYTYIFLNSTPNKQAGFYKKTNQHHEPRGTGHIKRFPPKPTNQDIQRNLHPNQQNQKQCYSYCLKNDCRCCKKLNITGNLQPASCTKPW